MSINLLQSWMVIFYFLKATDSPPYILILTNCLDGTGMNIFWVSHLIIRRRGRKGEGVGNLEDKYKSTVETQVSIMQYMTSMAPPALTATAISIMATIIWVLGKGVSGKILRLH